MCIVNSDILKILCILNTRQIDTVRTSGFVGGCVLLVAQFSHYHLIWSVNKIVQIFL